MKSGMLAAEAAFKGLVARQGEDDNNDAIDMTEYAETMKNSWIYEELYLARNIRPVKWNKRLKRKRASQRFLAQRQGSCRQMHLSLVVLISPGFQIRIVRWCPARRSGYFCFQKQSSMDLVTPHS